MQRTVSKAISKNSNPAQTTKKSASSHEAKQEMRWGTSSDENWSHNIGELQKSKLWFKVRPSKVTCKVASEPRGYYDHRLIEDIMIFYQYI